MKQLLLLVALLPLSLFIACSEGTDDPEEGGDGDGDMGGESSGDGDGDSGDGDTGDGDGDGDAGDGDGDEAGDGDMAGTGGFAPMLPSDVTTPKIMIVGDSISAGPGCYKKYLAEHLTDGGHSFEFVGEYDDDCGGGVMHSAVSCTTSGQFTQESFTVPNCFSGSFPGMAPLMATHQPDVVMIQLGVNDVWGGGGSVTTILSNYATLVEQARAENPNVLVFVAQIHKIITDNCENENSTAKAQELVEAVPGWAAEISTEESPVVPADLWTNSDPMDANDCVHPNDAGARRMGENWYEAMKNIIP